jgi:hypothetical protein
VIVVNSIPTDMTLERTALERVLRSPQFARAPRMAELLSYLCEKKFEGESGSIKEYAVGVDVFGRGADFDQESDSIVRVEANRLRKKLAEYYAGPGAQDPLHINIPLGQYVPDFLVCKESIEAADEPAAAVNEARRSRKLLTGLLVATSAIILVGLAATVWLGLRTKRQNSSVAANTASPVSREPVDLGIGPPVGDEIRILCGSARSLVDHAGRLWKADAGYDGGTAVKSDVQHIWRTQDAAFYRSSRQGQFVYDIPLKPDTYELRLHFAETEFGPEGTGTSGEGSRIMTILANGRTLLKNFDLVTDAGASRTADVKVFPDIGPDPDGKLHLNFLGERGSQAAVSAIEIVPGVHGRMLPVRVLTRQTPFYSNDSQWWSPDSYFQGGQQASYAGAVRGTDDPEFFASERWGNFSYAIPVSPGRYAVTLYFVARHGDWPPGTSKEGGGPAKHVFNVFCSGKVLLQDFDLAREARERDIVVRRFAGLDPNAQGKLLLSFVPVDGYATVAAIEVAPQ